MNTLYKTPKLVTHKHNASPYRGEWVIYNFENNAYLACHEVRQLCGEKKTVETVTLKSLADAQEFSIYLGAYGWQKVWEL